MVRDLINQESDSTSVDYCARVTANDGAIGDNYLKLFQDNEKTIPTILTTSQKLTTGVDARNVRNIVLLRPINSMIEFKQIIGRGTRLFEGKHFFTIVDFVNAYHLFSDKEWDGEPEGDGGTGGGGGGGGTGRTGGGEEKTEKKPKLRIRLSDGKVRELKAMSSTYFFVDGKPLSAEEFLKRLFDTIKLPELLGSEEQLRKLWSSPVTRRELLQRLESAGCLRDDLEKLQELIDAKDSDLFDVLEYIAYAKPPISRAARVESNRSNIFNLLNDAQQDFVGYVLRNYVADGVDELDAGKLSTTLLAKYGSLDAAKAELGEVTEIRDTFHGFQARLYSA
jgi:type I restriction enzyme R subunit